jgi:hypothetical protein
VALGMVQCFASSYAIFHQIVAEQDHTFDVRKSGKQNILRKMHIFVREVKSGIKLILSNQLFFGFSRSFYNVYRSLKRGATIANDIIYKLCIDTENSVFLARIANLIVALLFAVWELLEVPQEGAKDVQVSGVVNLSFREVLSHFLPQLSKVKRYN